MEAASARTSVPYTAWGFTRTSMGFTEVQWARFTRVTVAARSSRLILWYVLVA